MSAVWDIYAAELVPTEHGHPPRKLGLGGTVDSGVSCAATSKPSCSTVLPIGQRPASVAPPASSQPAIASDADVPRRSPSDNLQTPGFDAPTPSQSAVEKWLADLEEKLPGAVSTLPKPPRTTVNSVGTQATPVSHRHRSRPGPVHTARWQSQNGSLHSRDQGRNKRQAQEGATRRSLTLSPLVARGSAAKVRPVPSFIVGSGIPPPHIPTLDPPPPPQTAPTDSTYSPGERLCSVQSSVHLQTEASASRTHRPLPQKRVVSRLPIAVDCPRGPLPSPPKQEAHVSSRSLTDLPPTDMEELPTIPPEPLVAPHPSPILPSTFPAHLSTPDLHSSSNMSPTDRGMYGTSESTSNKRFTRSRPAPPQGPRKPSYSTPAAAAAMARMHASEVSPVDSSFRTSRITPPVGKFKPSRVTIRTETLTSQELQNVVSTAIEQSADASAVRLLPVETLDHGLPDAIERLEARCRELKTRYQLDARKRDSLHVHVSEVSLPEELSQQRLADCQMLEELGDLARSLDDTAEELYVGTDQLAQLKHLRSVHERSALAMGVRKLQSRVLKEVGEAQRLRERVAALEEERDEAWREAQEVAQEFDDFADRMMMSDASPVVWRSGSDHANEELDGSAPRQQVGRVMLARKSSQRASKAGLRSMHRHSGWSTTSRKDRDTGSCATSPTVWSSSSREQDASPLSPLPMRFSGDLPPRSSDELTASPTMVSAMDQAQNELYEMLGISLDQPGSPMVAVPPRRLRDIPRHLARVLRAKCMELDTDQQPRSPQN